ncbi:hypothetical protein OUZ56_012154 [Daphnia magna]|uniref:Uncharacterized protein n=1 Tax=Daphnia magna TaxID=35525 RepID=A0ABQ9Z2E0_9CRUS|nr:hypothetical protein OUZ56_012154 [Daphnia magna]
MASYGETSPQRIPLTSSLLHPTKYFNAPSSALAQHLNSDVSFPLDSANISISSETESQYINLHPNGKDYYLIIQEGTVFPLMEPDLSMAQRIESADVSSS